VLSVTDPPETLRGEVIRPSTVSVPPETLMGEVVPAAKEETPALPPRMAMAPTVRALRVRLPMRRVYWWEIGL